MYQPRERWKALCEQAAAEQDGVRLLEIINELNRVLDEGATPNGHPSRRVPEVFEHLAS